MIYIIPIFILIAFVLLKKEHENYKTLKKTYTNLEEEEEEEEGSPPYHD